MFTSIVIGALSLALFTALILYLNARNRLKEAEAFFKQRMAESEAARDQCASSMNAYLTGTRSLCRIMYVITRWFPAPRLPEDQDDLLRAIERVLLQFPAPSLESGFLREAMDSADLALPVRQDLRRADELVTKIANPIVTRLWQRGGYGDLCEIARYLILVRWMPNFDLGGL